VTPHTLSTDQWIKLAEAFNRWHFKPDVFEDETFLADHIVEEYMNTSIIPSQISKEAHSLLDAEESFDEMEELEDEHPAAAAEKA
jgi:hypothetical protein